MLSDYHLPGMDFAQNLALIRSVLPDIPVILVFGTIGEESAVQVLKSGVTEFVLKENLIRLVPTIERALREAAELRGRLAVEQALREKDALLYEVSRSGAHRRLDLRSVDRQKRVDRGGRQDLRTRRVGRPAGR